MKKLMIAILCTICFFSTGCYDYIDLSDRAIISSIFIDFEDNQYSVTFEILNSKDDTDTANQKKANYLSGEGKSVAEAFNSATLKSDKEVYYAHIKTLIISEEIANEHVKMISDYVLRSSLFQNNFYLVIAKNNNIKDMINAANNFQTIVGETIKGLIDHNKYIQTVTQKMDLKEFIAQSNDPYKSSFLPIITMNEENALLITGLGFFKNSKLQISLNEEQSATFALLAKESKNYLITNTCELTTEKKRDSQEKRITLNIYKIEQLKFIFNHENELELKAQLDGNLIQNDCNYDLNSKEDNEKLKQIFTENLNKDFKDLFELFKTNNIDGLNWQKMYVNKYRHYSHDWKKIDIAYDVNIKINKIGLIYEVQK